MKSKNIRLAALLLCLNICLLMITGCYDNSEIEDLAYVIAIGIDEADSTGSFNLTFQTAVPHAITGGGGESTSIASFKTDNFLSGLKKTSEYLSRKINLSHTKIIVISEAIAQKGVTAFLNGFQHGMEIRQNINIIVAAEGAKNYLESIQPKLTSNPSKYYDLLFRSYETDFLIPDTQLEDYLYRAKNQGTQPVAIYTSIDKTINNSKKPDGEQKKNMSINGLAVFKTDKMVGKLYAREASIFALMTGTKNINIDVVDPLDKRFKVLSNVKREKSSYTKVIFKNNKPVIHINIKLDIDVQAVQSDNDFDKPDNTEKLNKAYRDLMNKEITELLAKVTYGFKADIFGYGELAKRNFITIDEWEKINWSEIFPKTEYNLKLETEIIKHE